MHLPPAYMPPLQTERTRLFGRPSLLLLQTQSCRTRVAELCVLSGHYVQHSRRWRTAGEIGELFGEVLFVRRSLMTVETTDLSLEPVGDDAPFALVGEEALFFFTSFELLSS